jgi:hypothetical protein
MARKLLISIFIIAVVSNALAAVSPHIDGDGGCSADCCQAARENDGGVNVSRICCVMDCKQPAGTHAPSPTTLIMAERHKASANQVALSLMYIFSCQSVSFLRSQNHALNYSTHVYLKTGSLLI